MKFVCDCGGKFRCVDSRKSEDVVRRRYTCSHCTQRMTSLEVAVAYYYNTPSSKVAKERFDAVKELLFSPKDNPDELPGN